MVAGKRGPSVVGRSGPIVRWRRRLIVAGRKGAYRHKKKRA